MRPDQHKQKRSSDYKKKHNVDKKQTPASKGSELHDDLNEDESRKFGRAQIKSNWERYDEVTDEDADRGEDYSILVSRGGDASSHKKLTGEDNWDVAVSADGFDIDYQRLADQLSKLPLIERFSLDKLGLNCDILSCLGEKGSSETFCTSSNIELAAHPLNLINKDESNDLGFDFSVKPIDDIPIETKLHTGPNIVLATETRRYTDDTSKSDMKVQDDTSDKKNFQDDPLLDELLESTNVNVKPDLSDCYTQQSDVEGENTGVSDHPQDQSDTNVEVEDLEDWLDSIL